MIVLRQPDHRIFVVIEAEFQRVDRLLGIQLQQKSDRRVDGSVRRVQVLDKQNIIRSGAPGARRFAVFAVGELIGRVDLNFIRVRQIGYTVADGCHSKAGIHQLVVIILAGIITEQRSVNIVQTDVIADFDGIHRFIAGFVCVVGNDISTLGNLHVPLGVITKRKVRTGHKTEFVDRNHFSVVVVLTGDFRNRSVASKD